jgi:hypothetical protein
MARMPWTAALLIAAAPIKAQTPNDIPANHWAAKAAAETIRHGILTTTNNQFRGTQPITRTEMANAIAKLAQTLENGTWTNTQTPPLQNPAALETPADIRTVTRYETAALLCKIAAYTQKALPKPPAKPILQSTALPNIKLNPKLKNTPAYTSLQYLAQNRMLSPNSPLLTTQPNTLNTAQVTKILADLILGITDRRTDEPQNKDTITPKPRT